VVNLKGRRISTQEWVWSLAQPSGDLDCQDSARCDLAASSPAPKTWTRRSCATSVTTINPSWYDGSTQTQSIELQAISLIQW